MTLPHIFMVLIIAFDLVIIVRAFLGLRYDLRIIREVFRTPELTEEYFESLITNSPDPELGGPVWNDMKRNLEFSWRMEHFNSVPTWRKLFMFWRKFDSFYPDKAFLEHNPVNAELLRDVVKWIETHPERWVSHETGVKVVENAEKTKIYYIATADLAKHNIAGIALMLSGHAPATRIPNDVYLDAQEALGLTEDQAKLILRLWSPDLGTFKNMLTIWTHVKFN